MALEVDGRAFQIDRFEFPNVEGEKPRTAVTMEEAEAACGSAGKRLCTAAEWRRACLGPDGEHLYGYGSTWDQDRCHWGRSLPSGHTSIIDARALVAASGSFPDCRTPEGVYDLPGNMEEWVLDDWHGVRGMLEGGAWYSIPGYNDCTGMYPRQPDYRLDPDRRIPSAGFRCCASDLPPTPDDIARDSVARIEAARALASGATYAPDDEVPIGEGLWMDRYEYPNRAGEYPRVAVPWDEARGLCEAAGKRLCEVREWEAACTGDQDRPDTHPPMTAGSGCALAAGRPTRAGEREECRTAAGIHDLLGSAWEWTATPVEAPVLSVQEGTRLREIRGGSWYSSPGKGLCRPPGDYPVADAAAAWPEVGFRCCRGEPTDRSSVARPGAGPCPDGMVAIAGFCIDRYEHPNQEGRLPTAGLDYGSALEACATQGKRLCSRTEWLAACSGEEDRRWPWGNRFDRKRCNDHSDSIRPQAGGLAAAGTSPDCVTPEGVFDLSGNAWEWVDGEGGTPPLLLGGGENLAAGLGQCRSSARASTTYRDPGFGTRCCLDAGSGTLP